MTYSRLMCAVLCVASYGWAQPQDEKTPPGRLVILKVDGLNADLLARTMRGRNDATGKPQLPWFDEIFARNGVMFENFYVRGISLSAPSWSLLDTGNHLLIKGNVEYDRYTGRVYDYLNFFPFYIGYARQRQVDMPSVQVLDEAGVPLVIDRFPYKAQYQSFQLFQRGVRWTTLREGLKRGFSKGNILSMIEDPQSGLGLADELARQTERELVGHLQDNTVLYLDDYTGDVDHVGHAVNDPKMLEGELQQVDALAGRIWNAIEQSPMAAQTIFVVVSDHGMNNVPGVYSQTFSLPDLLNSPAGGAHHVVTNRHQLSEYKISGLDPLVYRVINPSTASRYLQNQANEYPTAWLDLDGNERAAVSFRNSEVNRIHILLKELSRNDLAGPVREAAVNYLRQVIDRQRPAWRREIAGLREELKALSSAIEERQQSIKAAGRKATKAETESGIDKERRREAAELAAWVEERSRYEKYSAHLEGLLALDVSSTKSFDKNIADLVPEMSLGDANSVFDLEHYVAGTSAGGLVLDGQQRIDEERSFEHVNYFQVLAAQRVRNNPQAGIADRPVDFTAMSIPRAAMPDEGAEPGKEAIWLYGDDQHQLIELVRRKGNNVEIRLLPAARLTASAEGRVSWEARPWAEDFPLHLYEDGALEIARPAARSEWLSGWHSEREWLEATHRCRYSNGVIGITEALIPPAEALPSHGEGSLLNRLELRRRELVQADFNVFAADHWNFNVRNFNPGGNHGSFLRIATHSVWMMAGGGLPKGVRVQEPYDSLNFASTVLRLAGKEPPMPDKVVRLGTAAQERLPTMGRGQQ